MFLFCFFCVPFLFYYVVQWRKRWTLGEQRWGDCLTIPLDFFGGWVGTLVCVLDSSPIVLGSLTANYSCARRRGSGFLAELSAWRRDSPHRAESSEMRPRCNGQHLPSSEEVLRFTVSVGLGKNTFFWVSLQGGGVLSPHLRRRLERSGQVPFYAVEWYRMCF